MSLLSQDTEPFRPFPVEASPSEDTDLFSFSGSVGPNGENRREDVIRAQTLLARTGDFDPEGVFKMPTGWPSSDLYRGIRKFQKRIGLDADGTLLPMPSGGVDEYGAGETVEALRGELGEHFAGQKARTPSQVDAHYEQSAQGATGEKPSLPARPETVGGNTSRPLPEHKKDVFGLPANKDAWDAHQAALHKQLPDRPVLRHLLGSLYAEEGGRIPDPASGAVGGILPETLEDMQRRGKLPDLPAHLNPGDLTPEQQVYLQNAYFDDILHTIRRCASAGRPAAKCRRHAGRCALSRRTQGRYPLSATGGQRRRGRKNRRRGRQDGTADLGGDPPHGWQSEKR